MPRTGLQLALIVGFCVGLSVQNEDCLLPRDRGDSSCGAAGGLRFHYDTRTRHCQPFLFEGCGGNANRFGSAADCKARCANVAPADAEQANGHGMVLHVPKCPGGVRAAIDDKNQPLACEACPENHKCVDGLCCPNQKAACDVDYDTGKYAFSGSHTPRYFFDRGVKNCLLFTYYGALGNANNFETYNECMRFCGAQ